jgi:DNA-directed RNA polymerase specialized sigma24 family protein
MRIKKVTIVPAERRLKYWDAAYPLIVPGCHTDEPSRVFKAVTNKTQAEWITSPLSNAPVTWVYPLDRYEIDSYECENVPTLIDKGSVHTIIHKIDGVNIKWHGLTKWINRQDKPVIGQEEIILFGKEYRNLHAEEAQQVERSHQLKSKRNTGGAQPESAIEAPDDFLQWMQDMGAAQERSSEESEKEFADRIKELQRIGEPTKYFAEPASPMSGMVWDGDSFLLEDQAEYFDGRVIPERIRLTAAERAAAFNEHKTMVEAGAVDLREDELILEVKLEYRTREEVAEELGISVDALDKRIQRRDLEARAMQDGKFQIPYLALTYEQAADIADNNAVYLQVDLNGWRWYKLDVDKHGAVDQAIEALKVEKLSEALRQRPEYKAAGRHGTNERYPEWTVALKEVKDRYDKQVFHPDRIRIAQRPPRPKQPWEGLLSGE